MTDYDDLIRREGAFWDKEFVFDPNAGFQCFLHASPWIQRHVTHVIIDRILAHVRPGVRVLDLGCGKGWLSIILAQHGAEVTGTDIAEKCLDSARKWASTLNLPNCKFDYLDLNRDPIAGRYDMILSWGTLHHVLNLNHAVTEIAKSLSENGKFILVECREIRGFKKWLARALAGFFHLILPTDRPFTEKIRYYSRKLKKNEQEYQWSPLEMVGGGDWEQTVLPRFYIEYQYRFSGFISPFIHRIRLSPAATDRLTLALFKLDTLLLRLRLLEPEYYFAILAPRTPE